MGDREEELTVDEAIEDAQSVLDEVDVGSEEASGAETDRSSVDATSGVDATVQFDTGVDDASSTTDDGGLLDRLPSLSSGTLFSGRSFVLTGLALAAGYLGLSALVPFLPVVFGVVGLFLAAFLAGLVGGKDDYLETGAAAAVVGGVFGVLANVRFLLATDGGPGLVAASVAVAVVAALLGRYFGGDLREGLTRDL
jgi:hypothetical protein